MKILLVGGGGFIGTNLCIGLLDQGHEIRVFDRNDVENTPLKSFADKIEWRKGDFTDERDIKQAVEDCDIVYHLLSTTIPKSSNDNPIFDIQSNLVGTIQLLQILKTSNVKKLIFVSSGGTIYGVPQTISIA